MKERQKVDSHFTCCVKAMLCLSWLGLGTAGLILYHLHDNLKKPPIFIKFKDGGPLYGIVSF